VPVHCRTAAAATSGFRYKSRLGHRLAVVEGTIPQVRDRRALELTDLDLQDAAQFGRQRGLQHRRFRADRVFCPDGSHVSLRTDTLTG
jgi:hypothetical protein